MYYSLLIMKIEIDAGIGYNLSMKAICKDESTGLPSGQEDPQHLGAAPMLFPPTPPAHSPESGGSISTLRFTEDAAMFWEILREKDLCWPQR